jgi:hypothetical protein
MGWERSTHLREVHTTSRYEKPERMRVLRRSRSRWDVDIKTDIIEIE